MKNKRRLPIFLEFSIVSTIIIVVIIAMYSVVQIISMNMLSIDYEKEQIQNRYTELRYVLSNEELEDSILSKVILKDDESIRIYKDNEIKYIVNDDIWRYIPLERSNKVQIKCKYINWEMYIVLDGNIEINNVQYNIQIAQKDQIFEEFIDTYENTFIISLVIGIVLSVSGGIYLSKRFVRRLRKISYSINEVKENGIRYRIPISSTNDEFDKINILFNEMMDKVEETFNEQSRFVSDASHELRTPLTALQGHIRMIKRWGKNDKERLEKSLDICIDETKRLTKIVEDLLVLSRCDNEVIDLTSLEPIKIKEAVLQVADYCKVLNNNNIINLSIDEDLTVKMKLDHLKQIMIIFIDNAIKYNNKEQCIIEIAVYEENDKVIFKVKDNGRGIPKEDLPFVLNRFYKVDKSRKNNNSFGLGLSIAEKIISLYEGTIKIESEENEYTEILFIIKTTS